MKHLEVSCEVRRFFKSLGFKGLIYSYEIEWLDACQNFMYNRRSAE